MDLFGTVKSALYEAAKKRQATGDLPDDLNWDAVTVEPPRDPSHGDMASNAAMVFSKSVALQPRQIAELLKETLQESALFETIDVAGPGFLNFRLSARAWATVLPAILKDAQDYGRSRLGAGQRVNIEFVSANPTGPLHIGHTRGAVFGDALANLLIYAGFDVTREYYINDGGAQVDVLARSVYLRYLEAWGEEVVFPSTAYPGDYLIEVGQAAKRAFGDRFLSEDEGVWLTPLREFAIDQMMAWIREDLGRLNIEIDVFFSELSLYGTGRIEETLAHLYEKGLIYDGVLEPPKGKTPEDWEPREQTLFRATSYGDDVDRPIKKSDGSWTYFAPDIAYHYDKIQRGYDRLIDIFGADHGGYVKRMKAAVAALSDNQIPLNVMLTQIVHLFKDGQPMKMSKREGTFISLREVVEQVGSDVTRFVMLMRKNDAQLDFDFSKILEQSKENPVFYVQYAHARISSVLRKSDVNEAELEITEAAALALDHPSERRLVAKLAEWPRLVELAAVHHEPHRVSYYLYELAGIFHTHWNLGKTQEELRLLQDNGAASKEKIALALATAHVLRAGLRILGVKPLQEM